MSQLRSVPNDAKLPLRVQEICAAVHHGRIWIAGGLTSPNVIRAEVRSFDPVSRTWLSGPMLNPPRHHMALVSMGKDLYALGGMTRAQPLGTEQCLVLRDGARDWEPIASMEKPRSAAAAAAIGDRLVVAGGQEAPGKLAEDTLIYQPATDRWLKGAPITTPREHLAGFVRGGELVAVSGRRFGLDTGVPEVEAYDPETDLWRPLASIPFARGGLTVTLVRDTAYAIGGEMEERALTRVDAYDVRANAWRTLPPLSVPRHGHGAALVGDSLYLLGGSDRPNYGALDTLLQLDVAG